MQNNGFTGPDYYATDTSNENHSKLAMKKNESQVFFQKLIWKIFWQYEFKYTLSI